MTGVTKNFVVKNGLTTGNIVLDASDSSITANSANLSGNLTVSGTSDLGNVSNIKISGGSNGQVLTTDGSGNLSFKTVQGSSGNPAPMPYYIPDDTTVLVPEFYQGLYLIPITIDGHLEIDGILIQITG